jgi:S-adenosylmethionine:tRNA ribosyltransferase-isomerase
MHSEFASIPSCTAQAINAAKKKRHRVIAVGTTTVRTLEGAALLNGGNGDCVLRPDGFSGEINLFISPGFDFKIVDGLITNFHLPKSTLLVLLSAFAGRDRILDCYDEAIRERYRFYSFGDAMFIR